MLKVVVFVFGLIAGVLIATSLITQNPDWAMLTVPILVLLGCVWVIGQVGPRIIIRRLSQAVREQGERLKDAEVEVFSLNGSVEPGEVFWETTDQGKEIAEEQGFYRGARKWYLLDVQIQPQPLASGGETKWYTGAIQLIEFENHDRGPTGLRLDGVCFISEREIWHDGAFHSLDDDSDGQSAEESSDEEADDRKKQLEEAVGQARIRLKIGVAESVQRLKFWYFGEEFGTLELS